MIKIQCFIVTEVKTKVKLLADQKMSSLTDVSTTTHIKYIYSGIHENFPVKQLNAFQTGLHVNKNI